MSYSHNNRGHPEVPINLETHAMHSWEKRQVHKGIRRFYKNYKWLSGAMADTDGLNPSDLRVRISP